MEEENNQLRVRESSWEENFKSQDQQRLSKLEHLRQSNKEALKKYQKDTKKNLAEALPILRSNLREWRQLTNFFISKEPEIKEANLEELVALVEVLKECLQLEGAPTEPTDQPQEEGD
ncbi:hypothetical protein J1N35_007504 [Gossypium stocksii]|uniref:Uncharacterized protein n=1 Tax=Gossypium stocksii TaxID=47602 RepID=A0A9D3W6S3_9ROSI|nr:hypothetical protein J1N35_007504 [Gossypium stocksii]